MDSRYSENSVNVETKGTGKKKGVMEATLLLAVVIVLACGYWGTRVANERAGVYV